MWKKTFAASMLLAAVSGWISAPSAWAKPSDLPVENQMQCPDCGEDDVHGSITIGLDVLTGRVTVEVEDARAETQTGLDTLMPSMVIGYLEQVLQQLGACAPGMAAANDSGCAAARKCGAAEVRSPKVAASDTDKVVLDARDERAVTLFKIAESCRRSGDFAKARTCYQQVHLLTPTSRVGQMAIDRLVEIEERMRDAVEESETPAPAGSSDESLRELRDGTMFLGLVRVTY